MAERAKERVRQGISDIQPYVPGLSDDELKRMYDLPRVVKLNSNENALGPSPLAVLAIRDEIEQLNLYPDGSGATLRQAIANFHGVPDERVFVGNGSDNIIKLLSETLLEADDVIVVPTPSFSQYGFAASVMRAQQIEVPLQMDFSYNVQALAAAVTEKTKLVYICSPNNPTGTIITQAQTQWLLEHLPENVFLVLDLAYNDYSVHPERVVETEALLTDPRIIVLHTFSKLYGLAGLRLGYALGDPDLWAYVHRVREPFNVNRIAQRAGVAALQDVAHVHRSQAHVLQSREYFEQQAKQLGYGIIPSEGNFVLMDVGDGKRVTELLTTHGIMVRAGFKGLNRYVRITFGTPEENQLCMTALKQVIEKQESGRT